MMGGGGEPPQQLRLSQGTMHLLVEMMGGGGRGGDGGGEAPQQLRLSQGTKHLLVEMKGGGEPPQQLRLSQEPPQQPPRPVPRLPGFRFRPTDEELLTGYLRNKVDGRPLPAGLVDIPTVEVFTVGGDPWVVWQQLGSPCGNGEQLFCFTHRVRRGPGFCRTTGSGTWAAKGKNVAIRSQSTGQLLGRKLMLTFVGNGAGEKRGSNCSSSSSSSVSSWIMYEYCLPDNGGGCTRGGRRRDPSSSSSSSSSTSGELVLCSLHRRGRRRG